MEKTFNRPRNSFGHSVQQTSDEGYIICGRTDVIDTLNITSDRSGIWLIKTNSFGDTIWTKIYFDNNTNSYGYSVQETSDGGYIICGIRFQQGFVIKTDLYGDTIWTKSYEMGENSYLYSTKQTIDGGYIFGGRTLIVLIQVLIKVY